MPSESTQPPSVQKSFCMSITTMALRLRSMVMFCGAAAILSGTGLTGAAAMSTSRALALQAEPARGAPSGCILLAIGLLQKVLLAGDPGKQVPRRFARALAAVKIA